MFLHVASVHPVRAYALRVEFTDGTVMDVDLVDELYGEVFEPLREPSFFARAHVNPETGTIEWPNGADFAPEFLFRIGRDVHRVA